MKLAAVVDVGDQYIYIYTVYIYIYISELWIL